MAKKDNYALKAAPTEVVAAPALAYQPPRPRKRYGIALIGCGGISAYHLAAYRRAGWDVRALCDVNPERAEERRKEYFPTAAVCTDYRQILERDDVQVVDVSTYPRERLGIITDAIEAGKHVLSQKPFVLDLRQGEKLVALAKRKGVKLAVNQNGRWAPHFSYMRQAVGRGLLGDVFAAHLSVHWDHNWIKDKPFNEIRHIVLYDFAIHWFDMLTVFLAGHEPLRVYASFAPSPSQQAKPNLLAQVLVEYEKAQASLVFDADVRFGAQDRSYVAGSEGTISSVGPDLGKQQVTLHTRRGVARPRLKGHWFTEGFMGTMGELLCAIEEDRSSANSAAGNLAGLALCFAAIQSADTHKPAVPGKVRQVK